MDTGKMPGLVLLVVGLILLYFGWQSSQSLGDQLTEAVSGRFTDATMWYILSGAAASIAGVYMLIAKR